jgi:hypothetical protein
VLNYAEPGFGDELFIFELWTKAVDPADAGAPSSLYIGVKAPHPPPNVWLHVVAVRRASRTELWVNGQLAKIGLSFGTISNTARLVWGAESEGLGGNLHGALDELALYDRDLSEDSIRAHWCAGAP